MVTTTDLSVAKEILSQLGGNKFIVIVGAKNICGDEKSISFKIMRNCEKITHVKIALNSLDLYDMTFYSIRGVSFKIKSEAQGIYNDMLQSTFTQHTGLNTYL